MIKYYYWPRNSYGPSIYIKYDFDKAIEDNIVLRAENIYVETNMSSPEEVFLTWYTRHKDQLVEIPKKLYDLQLLIAYGFIE